MSGWRYIASRLNGDGTESFLDWNLPLSDVSVQECLSGHGGLDAKITPEVASLKDDDGKPIFVPWSTAIYAEASGQIRGAGIVTQNPMNGPELVLDGIGFSGYWEGQPWLGEDKYDTADPLVIDRYIIEEFQKKPFNLGLVPAGAKESQRVQLSETVTGKKELYYLAYWQTLDLDKERTQLAEIGGYEWTVKHRWADGDQDRIIHEIEYGYPKLGSRRTDLRFVVGENILDNIPATDDGDEYASHVLVLGSGQGRKMVRAEDSKPTKRLGRWKVVSDKSIGKDQVAKTRVASELKALSGELDITEITVWDHPNAPVGTYHAGDEILIQSGVGWADFGDLWVRILGIIHHPEKNTSTLQIRRSEKIT